MTEFDCEVNIAGMVVNSGDLVHADAHGAVIVPEEYAVGLAGNHRNTNGGVALGYGYGPDGALSTAACESSLWTTGQNLRSDPAVRSARQPGRSRA